MRGGCPHGLSTERGKGETRATQVAQTERGVFRSSSLGDKLHPCQSIASRLAIGGYALGFPPLAGVSPPSWTLPLPSERGTLCDALCGRLVRVCVADWCGLAWRVAAHNNGGEAPFKENYALLKKLSEM